MTLVLGPAGTLTVADRSEVDPPNEYKLEDVRIKLTRGPCFGSCPVYSVEILGGGTVLYDGQAFVSVEGVRSSVVGREQLLELVNDWYALDFQALRPSYRSGQRVRERGGKLKVLTQVTSDAPVHSITVQLGPYTKTVNFETQYAPKAVVEYGRKIDEVVNSKHWVTGGPETD